MPRSQLISLDATPHYHVVSRERALGWDDREVARRWMALFGGTALVRSFAAGETLSEPQLAAVALKVDEYRKRLFDISWFMRCLNEPIARMANAEDNASGRFWEGRFKSQALLDEAALVAAMAYVDLNPIRAGMAQTPEESDYTAIQQRILEQDPKIADRHTDAFENLPEDLQTAIGKLMPFSNQASGDQKAENAERAIPYEIQDYLELVDWSGRAVVEGKRGSISENLPPILERLKIDPAAYIKFINRSEKTRFGNFIGPVEAMRDLAELFGKSFLKGQSAAAQLFSPG